MNAEAQNLAGVRARIVYTRGPDDVVDIVDGVVVYDGGGRIRYCEDQESFSRRGIQADIAHHPGKLIIPGLIDCHLHLPQLDQRGKYGSTLIQWLRDHILPAEKAFADEAVVEDVARRFFKKLILNGTTTAAIYSTIHEGATHRAFELAECAGVRAIIGKVMMDRHASEGLQEETAASIEASARLCERWHMQAEGRLRYAFTPRFAPACSLELLQEVGRLAASTGAYVQSHIAETEEENALVRDRFPDYSDYFELFEGTGMAGPYTMLAHAIYLTDGEYRRMARTNTSIVHCPTSNFFLKSGTMSIRRVEEAGVIFGLGSDVGAGTAVSLFTEMRHADYAQTDIGVTPAKALYLATLGGARTLSLADEVGSFERGTFADFCIVDIQQIDYTYELSSLNTDELLSLLMYRGDGRAVVASYVGGSPLNVDFL